MIPSLKFGPGKCCIAWEICKLTNLQQEEANEKQLVRKKCSENCKPPHQGLSPEAKLEGRFGPKTVCTQFRCSELLPESLRAQALDGSHSWDLLRGGWKGKVPPFPFWASSYISPSLHLPTLILLVPVVPGTSSAKTRTLCREKKKKKQKTKPLCFLVPKILIINIHNTKPVKPARQKKSPAFYYYFRV